jgi:hypothetical protein
MDSVATGGIRDVMGLAWVLRGRSAVARSSELCAQASELCGQASENRHKAMRMARVRRARMAVDRAGDLRAEATTHRLAAEAILGSLTTSRELDTATASPR